MLLLNYENVKKSPGYFRINKKAKRRVGRSGAREMQLTVVNKISSFNS
jgi:hypothetical protein